MPGKMEGIITRWVRGLQHVGGTISEGPVIGLLMFFTHKALRNVFFEVLRRGSQYGLMDVIRELCDAADALAQRANIRMMALSEADADVSRSFLYFLTFRA